MSIKHPIWQPSYRIQCHVVKALKSLDTLKLNHSEHYPIRGKGYHPLLPDKQALCLLKQICLGSEFSSGKNPTATLEERNRLHPSSPRMTSDHRTNTLSLGRKARTSQVAETVNYWLNYPQLIMRILNHSIYKSPVFVFTGYCDKSVGFRYHKRT